MRRHVLSVRSKTWTHAPLIIWKCNLGLGPEELRINTFGGYKLVKYLTAVKFN